MDVWVLWILFSGMNHFIDIAEERISPAHCSMFLNERAVTQRVENQDPEREVAAIQHGRLEKKAPD